MRKVLNIRGESFNEYSLPPQNLKSPNEQNESFKSLVYFSGMVLLKATCCGLIEMYDE